MALTSEQLESIEYAIDNSVSVSEDIAIIIDQQTYYDNITAFDGLNPEETDPLFIDYLDLKIKLENLQVLINSSKSQERGVQYREYDALINTLSLAEQAWGSSVYIGKLYELNSSGSDFEIFSSGKIKLPLF